MTGQDIYTDIADQIIAAQERGVAPWRRPWRVTRGTGFPTNHATGRSYSGINVMILAWAQMNDARTTLLWLTYKQAQGLGGQVRKGERGTKIMIMKPVTRKRPKEGQDPSYMMARSATVFNLDQIDGLELPEFSELPAVEPIAAAEGLVAAYLADGPSLAHGGNRACYVPGTDAITLPPRDHFDSPAGVVDCPAYDGFVAALQGRGWLPLEPELDGNPDGEGKIGRWRLTDKGRVEAVDLIR
jgi:antirestriction protein ArdC